MRTESLRDLTLYNIHQFKLPGLKVDITPAMCSHSLVQTASSKQITSKVKIRTNTLKTQFKNT